MTIDTGKLNLSGLTAPGLAGAAAPEAALQQLLSSSDLVAVFRGPKHVLLTRADKSLLGAVRVRAAGSFADAGINGSSDQTATEGSQSYTSNALNIGSKTPLSIRETPQSVSVVTRQRIEDQHMMTVEDALDQTAGITVVQGGSSGGSQFQPSFYSRGFQIQSFQVDGGAALITSGDATNGGSLLQNVTFDPLFDLSEYDHVEVLRGADGQYVGTGAPGGVVSLERKRPVDGQQFIADVTAGSYNDHRVVLDESTPWFADHKLRARFVLTHEDKNFFYKTAFEKLNEGYANIEYDPTPGTVINVGARYGERVGLPWSGGLPRYSTGASLDLPRSTCLCAAWSRDNLHTLEYFAQLRQKLGARWSFDLNFTGNYQRDDNNYASVYTRGVDPANPDGTYLYGASQRTQSTQYLLDTTIHGAFDLFKNEQTVVLGADFQRTDATPITKPNDSVYYTGSSAVDVFHFDPSAASPSQLSPTPNASFSATSALQTQWGVYGSLRFTPWKPLHFMITERVNSTQVDSTFATQYSSSFTYTQTNKTSQTVVLLPTVAVTYDLTRHVSVYASYADIYVPNTLELTASGKPILPTTGSNYEGGVKASFFHDTLNASATIFRIEEVNIPVQDYNNSQSTFTANAAGQTCCYIQSGEKNLSSGFELELSGALTRHWQIAASYAYDDDHYQPGPNDSNPSTSSLVSRAPYNLIKLWTTYNFAGLSNHPVLSRVQVGLGAHIQSAAYESGSVQLVTGGPYVHTRFSQNGYAVFDAMAKYKITDNISAQLNLTNIFDKIYYQTIGGLGSGNWYGTPRSFSLSFRFKY